MKTTGPPTHCRNMYRLQSTAYDTPNRDPRVRNSNGKRNTQRHQGVLQGILGPMIQQCPQHVHAPLGGYPKHLNGGKPGTPNRCGSSIANINPEPARLLGSASRGSHWLEAGSYRAAAMELPGPPWAATSLEEMRVQAGCSGRESADATMAKSREPQSDCVKHKQPD